MTIVGGEVSGVTSGMRFLPWKYYYEERRRSLYGRMDSGQMDD
jgi:hypothetical protein